MAFVRIAAISGLVLALAACAPMLDRSCPGGQEAAVQDTLYFGTAKPDGVVSPEEWAGFLSDVVTQRFPEGLTVLQASGQWKGADGSIVREASNVLVLAHPDDETSEAAILEIMGAYKARFQQEAVLRLRSMTCVSF